MHKRYDLMDESETRALAQKLSAKLKAPTLICLYGDLGMGKSVFAREMIRNLCNDPNLDVPSPTYTLVQIYEDGPLPIYHYDLYRIKDVSEMEELYWDDALFEGIVITEWSERIEDILPTSRIDIRILPMENKDDGRIINIIDYRETAS